MAGRSTQTMFDEGSEPTRFQIAIRNLRDDNGEGFGKLLASFVPGLVIRTGRVSGTVHVDGPNDPLDATLPVPEPGRIHGVTDEAGTTNLVLVYGGAPAAGEVAVAYSATGIPTLTFQAAVTGYQVEKSVLPFEFAEALAAPGSA